VCVWGEERSRGKGICRTGVKLLPARLLSDGDVCSDAARRYLLPRQLVGAQEQRAKERLEQKRERKAARTLAVITGTFVVCWLPFFVVALVCPFRGDRCLHLPALVVGVIGWLGYLNSLLNPIIYTVFNPDFRSAFRKILYGKYRRRSGTRRRRERW